MISRRMLITVVVLLIIFLVITCYVIPTSVNYVVEDIGNYMKKMIDKSIVDTIVPTLKYDIWNLVSTIIFFCSILGILIGFSISLIYFSRKSSSIKFSLDNFNTYVSNIKQSGAEINIRPDDLIASKQLFESIQKIFKKKES